MSDVKARVSTVTGQTIGYFVNPKVVLLCEKDFEVIGSFTDENGTAYDKVEFNPEVMPYSIDLSELTSLGFKSIEKAYVQRGRQPIRMTGVRV